MARRDNDKIDYARLCGALRHSRQALEFFRQERTDNVRQLAGNHYSENGTAEKVPVNLLAMYQQTISRSLISKNPRVLLSTFQRPFKAVVDAMGDWVNPQLERMRFAEVMQDAVIDALYCTGIVWVGVATPSDAAAQAWQVRAGEPFVKTIDLDDWVVDMRTRNFREWRYVGHRVEMPRDVAEKWFGKAKLKDVPNSDHSGFNEQGDERIGEITYGQFDYQEEFEDTVRVWEIYLPRHRKVCYLTDDAVCGGGMEEGVEPLLVKDYIGPPSGPCYCLGLGKVPGNLMPKAPITDLIDLHMSHNETVRKIMRTVARVKEVTGVASGETEDGERVIRANDGEMIRMRDPKNIAQIVFGGSALQTLVGIAEFSKQLFDFLGGNLALLGGREQSASTATQEKLLAENAGAGIADYQDRTIAFVSDVVEAVLWLYHHHPSKVMDSVHEVPGMPDEPIQRTVTPDQRARVPFDALRVKVDPYSLSSRTPQSVLASLKMVLGEIVMPLMPLLQQQGVGMDAQELLRLIAKLLDFPELSSVLTIQEPPEAGPGGATGESHERTLPPSTNREYTRTSVSEGTAQGQGRNLVQSMLSGSSPGGNVRANGQPRRPSMNGVG